MKTFSQVIQAVQEDETSGSSRLVELLIKELINQYAFLNEEQKLDVIKQIESLYQQKPFFVVLEHLITTLKKGWDEDSMIQYLEEINKIQKRISDQFVAKTKPGPRIFLLHSHSETIINVFEFVGMAGMKPIIFQTKSEPLQEGIIQAKRLKNLGFQVEVVEDDVQDSVIDQLDYFVTGADLITPDTIINKSGTLKIVERVVKKEKPYIVLADYRKFTSAKIENIPNDFEVISRNLIAELITGQ